MLPRNTILLIAKKLIPEKNLAKAIKYTEAKKLPLLDFIFDKRLVTEEHFYRELARMEKLPFVTIKGKPIRKDILFLVPETISSSRRIIAFDKTDREIKLATTDAENLEIFEFIARKTGLTPKICITTPTDIDEALKQFKQSLKAEFESIATTKMTGVDEKESKKLKELAEDLPVIRIVDSLLEHAIFEGASDVHVEPMEKEVKVRFRIDGILRNVMSLPHQAESGIVARIKVLSNLKLDEHRLPQDGRFKISTKEYKYSVRVSIFPVFDGEKVVMRLLSETAGAVPLEKLGLLPRPFAVAKRNIKKPHGVIFVTGPTGSGKTTTLYSIMSLLNKPGVNIATVEDPIEYRMPGVNQSQVNARIGFTFARGLRSLLRQDPDIIMVGEIRDPETADIAINAAMTGHLVLSTLHTNDAVTSLPRLIDMGVPSFLVAFTTNLIIAQRLVRKICKKCIKSYKLNAKQIAEIQKFFNTEAILKTLKREKFLKPADTMASLKFYRGEGCRQCGSEGYKGRIGIFEALEVTRTIADLIHIKARAGDLKDAADKQGMITLVEDGFIKAIKGVTTLEEILRVTKE
ncbi:MAG: type II/IV secretion system protein [Parcubacteria group bacterium]|nr:type II/IV secretion system protein [Parcubacteria group bacterium]